MTRPPPKSTLFPYPTLSQSKTGPPSSDEATMTLRFSRHDDLLTVLAIIEDPVYLAEPWVFSKNFQLDRKSTRLSSSHSQISYAVFCLKKKKQLTSSH